MIADLLKAVRQLPDPAFRRVVLKSFLWSVLLFVALIALAWWGLDQIELIGIGWLDTAIDVLGKAAAFVIALLVFPGVIMIVIGFLLEDIVRAVEARHYPDLPPPRSQSLTEGLVVAVRLALITIVLNIALLPLYLIPVINIFVFYGLNGYLLGREYFELVALRRVDVPHARAMRRHHRIRLLLGGIIITLLLSVPFISWIMAVPATAFIVHVFERLRAQAPSA